MLRVKRKERGLTLREMGERMGYSLVFISDVERADARPPAGFIEKYMEALRK